MKSTTQVGILIALVTLAFQAPAEAQVQCPPPPNPNFAGCPLAIDNSVIQEGDANLNGQPDDQGSPGSFCGGNSAADCVGMLAAEVAFQLILSDPATQSVTCTMPFVDIWIMNNGCGTCVSTGFESVTLPAGTTTDPFLEIVVADINGDVCVCGPPLECSFSKEVLCADGVDGDRDGLIDGADPDCCVDGDSDGFCGAADCDDDNPSVHEAPDVVCDVTMTKGTAFNTRLNWIEQPGAVVDGITGLLSELHLGLDQGRCAFNDRAGNVYVDFQPIPENGDGYYFLMRAQNSCGESSYGRGPFLDNHSPCN